MLAGDLPVARLDAWLREHLPELPGEVVVERVAGGQSNPTYFVTYGDRRLVLRKKPPGEVLPSAHAIDREYRIQAALAGRVPVPRMVLYCDDAEVVGTPFYLMERVEGRVFGETAPAGLQPEERRRMYLSLADTLAQLHGVNVADAGLTDYGRPEGYFGRQLARWSKQVELGRFRETPELDRLRDALLADPPPDDGAATIVHGDYRLGNVIIGADLKVAAVLDWELSTLGHPLADLAHCCMAWRTTPAEYGGLAGLDLAALGIPGEAEFIARYAADGEARAPGPQHFAFALLRMAAIFEGIASRARRGNAAAHDALEVGDLSVAFARRGLDALG